MMSRSLECMGRSCLLGGDVRWQPSDAALGLLYEDASKGGRGRFAGPFSAQPSPRCGRKGHHPSQGLGLPMCSRDSVSSVVLPCLGYLGQVPRRRSRLRRRPSRWQAVRGAIVQLRPRRCPWWGPSGAFDGVPAGRDPTGSVPHGSAISASQEGEAWPGQPAATWLAQRARPRGPRETPAWEERLRARTSWGAPC